MTIQNLATGETLDWGAVLDWEPPHRVVLEWRPSRIPSTPTEVEVRFEPEGERTVVTLQHRGWERLGPNAGELRSGYDNGWPGVLARFGEAAAG